MAKNKIFEKEQLKLYLEYQDHIIKINWLGKCTLKNPSEFIDPILEDVVKNNKNPTRRIVFDFQNFTFMNSSAIIPIISILKNIKKAERGSVHVHYNKEERWQEILLGELKLFETDDKRIQIKGI
ncbi:MAG: SiaC family regulatory phosphoprotein [Spirochaetia bacterium]|nr:SiaC family regulatory phosphoprotein [Spirochaetia bacterium]